VGRKGYILFLYGIALFIVCRRYYKTNSGLVDPSVIAPTTYLYGILAIASSFLEGLPVVIATGLTVSLYWTDSKKSTSVATKTTPTTSSKNNIIKKAA
jgi:hypothetical protein